MKSENKYIKICFKKIFGFISGIGGKLELHLLEKKSYAKWSTKRRFLRWAL